jgi:hypothetical protein
MSVTATSHTHHVLIIHRRAGKSSIMKGEQGTRWCRNCHDEVAGRPGGAKRGPDVAWFVHCWPCARLATEAMELLENQPDGVFIQILRCRHCGAERACRPGWRTRCHICLDQRSAPDLGT